MEVVYRPVSWPFLLIIRMGNTFRLTDPNARKTIRRGE